MLLFHTIEKVKQAANIQEVIGETVKLTKKGSSWTGCCPFHGEKTPSFTVNEAQGFYKCFGCGAAGDVVTFVQENERLNFYEAIEKLAERYNIELEHSDYDTPEVRAERKDRAAQVEKALHLAERYYHKQLMDAPDDSAIWQLMHSRGIDRQAAVNWRMGFAPDSYDNIKTILLDNGLEKVSIELGLLGEKNGRVYDKYRGRLIIPNRNYRGALNGFIGRLIVEDPNTAKYINPAASEVYNKSEEVFGLFFAAAAIKKEGFAYLVEGNIDAVMMGINGQGNTVAMGGTAMTPEQVKAIKRHCDSVVIMTDGDAAGEKAAMKWIDELLRHDLRVNIIELPKGDDPDSYSRRFMGENKLKTVFENVEV